MPLTIMVVDDHATMREGLRLLLAERRPQWQVVGEAGDGREAIKMARQLNPDVMVIDVTMPGLNGVDATQKIIEASPNIKVVCLSMHADADFVTSMLKAGATGYVGKASSFDEVVTAIERVSRGGHFLGSGVANVLVDDFRKIAPGEVSAARTPLSPRESDVLKLLAEGNKTSAIATTLNISVKTVETHRRQIMRKLDLHNVPDLTKYAIRKGITTL